MAIDEKSSAEQVSEKVIQLLAGVSAHSDQHLAEVERDLSQMDELLGEAIKKLCESFMAIHQAVAQQQAIVDGLLAAHAPMSEDGQRLTQLRGEIERLVGSAVTSLQFQDMTSQLNGRMVRHLRGLRDVLGALDVSGTAAPEGGSALAMLNDISDQMTARFSELEGVARSTVNQRHMESGDIELF